ncbi:hypothetical protein ABEB36_005205, partial [Hypothenemus hampei]
AYFIGNNIVLDHRDDLSANSLNAEKSFVLLSEKWWCFGRGRQHSMPNYAPVLKSQSKERGWGLTP